MPVNIRSVRAAPAFDDVLDPAAAVRPPGPLGERDVHVWVVPPAPRTGVACSSSPAAGRRHARSHAAARRVVAGYLACDPRCVDFRRDDLGKPQIVGGDLHYSLAHAGDVALVGVGRGHPLGVDVEPVRRLAEREALVRRCFTARERAHVGALATDEDVLRLWVRKEAAAKATGEGLKRVFEGFDVLTDRAVPGWRIMDLETVPGHVAAAAVRDDVATVVVAELALPQPL